MKNITDHKVYTVTLSTFLSLASDLANNWYSCVYRGFVIENFLWHLVTSSAIVFQKKEIFLFFGSFSLIILLKKSALPLKFCLPQSIHRTRFFFCSHTNSLQETGCKLLFSSWTYFSAVTFRIDASAKCLRVSLSPRYTQSEKSVYTERKFNDIYIFKLQFEKLLWREVLSAGDFWLNTNFVNGYTEIFSSALSAVFS